MNASPTSTPSKSRWILPLFLITAACASALGAGLGSLIRFRALNFLGHAIESPLPFLGGEESFPPREGWPVTEASFSEEVGNVPVYRPARREAAPPAPVRARALRPSKVVRSRPRPARSTPVKRNGIPPSPVPDVQPPEATAAPPVTTGAPAALSPGKPPASVAPPPKAAAAPPKPIQLPVAPVAPPPPPAPAPPVAPVVAPVAPLPPVAPPPPPAVETTTSTAPVSNIEG